jgi:hypothetical protein
MEVEEMSAFSENHSSPGTARKSNAGSRRKLSKKERDEISMDSSTISGL